MEEEIRKTGIDIIGDASWGTHFCHFYQTKEDLIDVLVPYFKAGLENNEFCMWVTSEPLSEEEAKKAMGKAVANFDLYLERGQMEIVPHTEWYLKDGVFNLKRVLNAWVDKLNRALAKGYDGIRVAGNTAWLEKRDWKNFADYEEEVNGVIGKYRMMAVCTYSLDKCGASEVIDVICNHQFALIKRRGEWELIESSELKKAEEALKLSETRLNEAQEIAGVGSWDLNLQTGQLYWSDEFFRIFGYQPGKITPTNELFRSHVHPDDKEILEKAIEKTVSEGAPIDIEFRIQRKNGEVRIVHSKGKVNQDKTGKPYRVYGTTQDITERKKAEEEIRNLAKFPSEDPNPVLRIAKDGTILYVNAAGQSLLNEWKCKVGQPAPDHLRRLIVDGLSSGLKKEIEVKHRDRTFSFVLAPITAAGYVNAYGRDISERRWAEKRFKLLPVCLRRALRP